MSWPYHFLDLSAEENTARRLLLNKYGYLAQLSALSLIIAIAAWRWLFPPVATNKSRLRTPASAAASSENIELSSSRKAGDAGTGDSVAGEETSGLMAEEVEASMADGNAAPSRRSDARGNPPATKARAEAFQQMSQGSQMSRWLDGSIAAGWKETRRQVLAAGLWGAWLLVLVFRETGEDYLHLTKRFAQVAASLLPLHYLLGTSSRLSPLPFLFRLSSGGASTKYNAYHRLNGALILGLLACHASLYLNFYIQKGLLVKRAQDLDVQMGLGMAGTLTVLGFFAREAVRKIWRGAFVLTHVAGAGLVVLMLFFHASAARWYAVEAGIVYVAVLYEKLVRAQRRTKRAG